MGHDTSCAAAAAAAASLPTLAKLATPSTNLLVCPAPLATHPPAHPTPLTGTLRRLTTHVSHVLPVSDDGGSTAEIVRVIGGPAVGDIRSRCLRLADDRDEEVRGGVGVGRCGWWLDHTSSPCVVGSSRVSRQLSHASSCAGVVFRAGWWCALAGRQANHKRWPVRSPHPPAPLPTYSLLSLALPSSAPILSDNCPCTPLCCPAGARSAAAAGAPVAWQQQ